MSRSGRRALLLTASAISAGVVTAAVVGDRGGDGAARTVTAPAATLRSVPVAPPGPRPPLPAGWRRVRDARGGFTVGVPPGWSSRRSDGTLVLSSRDRTLAIAVGADRSTPGKVAPPRRYAEEAIGSLRGYRDLRATSARPLRAARYPGARATATGTYAATGVRQAITLVAVQRRGVGTFTLLAFRSARAPEGPASRVVRAVVGTLHAERPT